jgi:hypothetical protein
VTPAGISDAFALKLDASLAPVWTRRLGGAGGDASARGVGVDSSDNVVVVGTFRGSLDAGPGATVLQSAVAGTLEVFALTLSGASGQSLCAKNWGDAASAGSGALAVSVNRSGTGAVKDTTAVVGSFTKVIDFGGQTTALSTPGSNLGFLLEM